MSDDRFKQARRSLIDRNRQRQQSSTPELNEDAYHEDERTLMVSIDSVTGGPSGGGGGGGGSRRGLPPSPGRPSPGRAPAPAQDDFGEEATQMVDIAKFGIQPAHVEERTMPSRDVLSLSNPGYPNTGSPSPTQAVQSSQQVFSTGAQSPQPHAEFVPDAQAAGHKGQTAFIHIDALAGAQAEPPHNTQAQILNDPLLRQGYQFGTQSVQLGDVNLIFAQNPMGDQVVLRQIWAGDAASMPEELRARLKQLEGLNAPRLITLNGVVASQSGIWAELPKPDGYRLSAVVSQHGPQEKNNVLQWVKEAAETLDAIHAAELIYANLTPDALWIQPDNTVLVEPFDMLSFAKRGDLEEYGALELKRPAHDRVLSPATDVFSLAAVAGAALTGLPFDRKNLAQLDDVKLVKRLESAMARNPAERPQTAAEFAGKFRVKKASSGADGKFSLDLAELDIKIVAAIVIVLLGGFAGYMYWNQQQQQKEAERQHLEELARTPPGGEAEEGKSDGKKGDGAPTEIPVSEDPRVTVISSFETNPPDEEESSLPPEQVEEETAKLLGDARKRFEGAAKLASNHDREEEYTRALEDVTAAVRLHRGRPSPDAQDLLDELNKKAEVRAYKKDMLKRVNDAIAKNDFGSAVNSYRRLWAIDYRASALNFFNRYQTAPVRQVKEASAQDAEKDGKSDGD